MLSEISRQGGAADRFAHHTAPRSRWGRRLALVTAGVFCLSAVFPIAAGLSKDTSAFPEWWGPADVGVAAVLAALSVAVIILGGKHIDDRAAQASYRVYRVLIHVILAMTSVYILAGDRIVWSQGLPGIAWRTWLLMYGLPAWLTLQSPPGILAGGSSESGSRP